MQLGASGSLCWLQLLFRLINCSMKFEVAMLIYKGIYNVVGGGSNTPGRGMVGI